MYLGLSHHLSLSLVYSYFCQISYYVRDLLLIVMVSVCFVRSSSSLCAFLLTRMLVKIILRALRQMLWQFDKISFLRFHNRAETLSRIQARETVLFFCYCMEMSVWAGNFKVHYNQALVLVHSIFSCSRQIFYKFIKCS